MPQGSVHLHDYGSTWVCEGESVSSVLHLWPLPMCLSSLPSKFMDDCPSFDRTRAMKAVGIFCRKNAFWVHFEVLREIKLDITVNPRHFKSRLFSSGRPGFFPWVGKIPGERHDNPLQYSCLENPMARLNDYAHIYSPAWKVWLFKRAAIIFLFVSLLVSFVAD